MQHCISVQDMDCDQIKCIMQLAKQYQVGGIDDQALKGISIAHMFYEASTRTAVSFQLAAAKLGAHNIIIHPEHSAASKGEGVIDTVQTLSAMGVACCIIRHQENYLIQDVANSCMNMHVVNAGDGNHQHPTQALLDLFTILQCKPNLSSQQVAIVGDIKHSRVARSLYDILIMMEVGGIRMVSDARLLPAAEDFPQADLCCDLKQGLCGADIVVALRFQKERMVEGERLHIASIADSYRITPSTFALASQDAIFMHPGPVNVGLEVSSDMITHSASKIAKQVAHGVCVRAALLSYMLGDT